MGHTLSTTLACCLMTLILGCHHNTETMFEPIDHKDSDLEYRFAVRSGIEQRHGTLKSITSRDQLVGQWTHSILSDDGTPYILNNDGTVNCKFDEESTPNGRWEFADDRFTDHTWCKPSPEYGLDEGTWNIEIYHCMITDEGIVVLWNGDGSLQMTLTPTS